MIDAVLWTLELAAEGAAGLARMARGARAARLAASLPWHRLRRAWAVLVALAWVGFVAWGWWRALH